MYLKGFINYEKEMKVMLLYSHGVMLVKIFSLGSSEN